MMYLHNDLNDPWPIWSSDPKLLSRLSQRDEIIRNANYRRGYLIDFDYSKFADEASVSSHGQRTVCLQIR